MSDVFYFGCIGESGHFMHTTHGRHVHDVGDMPWGRYGQDGKLPPQENGQVQGEAMLHHKDGWTALSFWDRSVDTRFGCNSNFFFRGTYDFAEAVALARTAFPRVWARFEFKIVPFKGDDSFQEKADLILADHAEAEKLRAQEGEPRGTGVQHYLTLVDGLFGLRAVGPLSQNTEGEIAGTHAELWDTMTEEEQAEVERGIMTLKEKWKQ